MYTSRLILGKVPLSLMGRLTLRAMIPCSKYVMKFGIIRVPGMYVFAGYMYCFSLQNGYCKYSDSSDCLNVNKMSEDEAVSK